MKLLFLSAALTTLTANAAIYQSEILCEDFEFGDESFREICATHNRYTPSPVIADGKATYVGPYGFHYSYQGKGLEDLDVVVEWMDEQNPTCTATVNDEECTACYRCGDSNKVMTDCRNVPSGRFATCEELDGVFFPLDPKYGLVEEPPVKCYTDRDELVQDIARYMDGDFDGPPIGDWCITGLEDCGGLFANYENFNEPLNNWDTSSCRVMARMFYRASSFNQPLDQWDVRNVRDMYRMFDNAKAFNQDLPWETNSLEVTREMFRYAEDFDGDVSSFEMGKVTNMQGMFVAAHSFNGYVNSWDTSRVTNMREAFAHAYSFNQDVDLWETSRVTSMRSMFASAHTFNRPLPWDVSNVRDMEAMFHSASSFNQNLSDWQVAGTESMRTMFYKATSFDQNVCAWEAQLNVTGELPIVEYIFGKTACPVQDDPILGRANVDPVWCHVCGPASW